MRALLVLLTVVSACASPDRHSSASQTLPPPSTLVVTTTTLPRTTPLTVCDAPGYVLTRLPEGVVSPGADVDLPADRYNAIEGTSTFVFQAEDALPRVVLVRGSLPPDDWADRTVRIDVAGFDGALGTMPDGAWAVAWAESGSRCDQYSLIVYPPTTREEVTVIAEGLRR